MPHATPLTEEQRSNLQAKHGQWQRVEGRDALRRVFKGQSFTHAWSFMSAVALEAEKLNHHPEWSNVYRTVDVTLITHDTNGLTDLDLKLVQKIDHLADQLGLE